MTITEFTPEELESEEWRDVVGYEGIYSVSSLGRVRRDKTGQGARQIIRNPSPNKKGYLTLRLSKNGEAAGFLVHVLVAVAFIGPVPDGKQVNHKDGVKSNARLSNLEYLTGQENMDHAHAVLDAYSANVTKGSKHYKTRLTEDIVRDIRGSYARGTRQIDIARQLHVERSVVWHIIQRRTWKHI